MGVDYSASAVFGIKVSSSDEAYDIEEDTNLDCFSAGNAYNGDTEYVIGIGVTVDEFGWDELKFPNEEQRKELADLAHRLKTDAPRWFVGLSVY